MSPSAPAMAFGPDPAESATETAEMFMSMAGRILVVATLTTAVVGILDAVRGHNADLVVVFAIVATLQIALLVMTRLRRQPVTLRRDLAHWLERRAAVTGERYEQIIDRGMAEYRWMMQRERR